MHNKITLLKNNHIKKYLKTDYLYKEFQNTTLKKEQLKKLGCNTWLKQSPQKRMIFSLFYADLISKKRNLKILDIGSGINLMQTKIACRHHYTVIDLLAHDDKKTAVEFCKKYKINLIVDDWFNVLKKMSYFDLVISVDLFPNVDQRLLNFLQAVKPIAKSLRLLLTFYPDGRFYSVKRTNADELMCLKAWDSYECANVLRRSPFKFRKSELKRLEKFRSSIFPNKRCVAALKLKNIK